MTQIQIHINNELCKGLELLNLQKSFLFKHASWCLPVSCFLVFLTLPRPCSEQTSMVVMVTGFFLVFCLVSAQDVVYALCIGLCSLRVCSLMCS